MTMLLKIAIRNVRRHIRRTLLSAVTIAAGLLVFIYMKSIFSGMDRAAIDNMISLSVSSVKVHTRAYDEDREAYPLEHGIENHENIASFLQSRPRVTAVTPRTQFLGELSNYRDAVPVVGTIVEPATDTAVFDLTTYLEGSFFTDEGRGQVVLGSDLARELGVGVGDYITLYALTRYESRNADEFEIAGLLNTTDPAINKSSVLITYATADDLLDLEGLVTELDVALQRRAHFGKMVKDMHQVRDAVSEEFAGLKVYTFQELGAGFLEMSQAKQAYGMGFMAIILLIAGVGIFNTVLMSVYERIREVGVLRAHGMKPREVTTLFLLEGVLTGVLGSLLGIAAGIGLNWYLVEVGFPMDQFAKGMDTTGMPVWGTLYGEWSISAFVFAAAFGIGSATLASWIPARKASRLQVTDALRFV
jgi:putative ABC transport system permease protein